MEEDERVEAMTLIERLRRPVMFHRNPEETNAERREAADEIERLCVALTEIATHWANDYDHPRANNEMYRGPYGIGVVDGHRACTIIARAALNPQERHDG